jgi:DnaB-like helicase C terminal domain
VSRDEERSWINAEYPLLSDQVRKTYDFIADPGLRIPTGWESVDAHILGGPAPGEVVYILGRSHTGKSMFLLNIIRNNPSLPMVLFTLEMPDHQAISRLTSMVMNQPSEVIMRNLQHRQLDWQANPLLNYDVWVVDAPSLSLSNMRDVVLKIRHDYDQELWPRVVLIDYLELIRSPSKDYGYERAETLARDLKAWSKEMELPVFVCHQSNMTIKRWEPPDEGAARGAGYTEADAVLGIWHPGSNPALTAYDQHIYKARLIKNRIAGTLSDELTFQMDNALLLWDPIATDRLRLDVL